MRPTTDALEQPSSVCPGRSGDLQSFASSVLIDTLEHDNVRLFEYGSVSRLLSRKPGTRGISNVPQNVITLLHATSYLRSSFFSKLNSYNYVKTTTCSWERILFLNQRLDIVARFCGTWKTRAWHDAVELGTHLPRLLRVHGWLTASNC